MLLFNETLCSARDERKRGSLTNCYPSFIAPKSENPNWSCLLFMRQLQSGFQIKAGQSDAGISFVPCPRCQAQRGRE